jgi:tripartite motif-containing protein 71
VGKRAYLVLFASLVAMLVVIPAAAADTATSTFTGNVSASGTKTKTFSFNVTQTGTISASLGWTDTSANLDLFLVQPGGGDVAKATSTTANPETISYTATQTGTWKIRVRATSGSSDFTATVMYPVSAVSGNGIATFSKSIGFSGPAGLYAYGMDWDSTDNTILVGDYWNYRVWRYHTDGTLASSTPVSQHALGGLSGGITAPYDVEADATDLNSNGLAALWVADQGSSRIVEFDHNGRWLQTIGKLNSGQAGGTDATHPGHAYPYGCGGGDMHIPTHILVDTVFSTHYIYVSDPNCRAVYIYDHQGGFHGALDWTGSGVGTPIPRGVAEDAAGNIYVAEFNSRKIFVFDPGTKKIIGSIGRQSDMNDVRGIDIDQTHHLIYTVGAYWNRTYEFTYDPAKVSAGTGASSVVGTFVNEWRNIDGSNYASGHQAFDSIRFPAVDGQGNVYTGETWGCDTYCTGTAYGYGVEKFQPGNIANFPNCNVSNATNAVNTCAGATRLPWATGPQPPPRGGFNQQNGIAIDSSDDLYAVDTFEQRVQKFDLSSTCTAPGSCPAWMLEWGSRKPAAPTSDGFGYPRALTFGDDGRIWVGDNNNDVMAFTTGGSFVHRFGSQGKTAGQFSGGVQGIDVEGGKVYATDVGGCRLQVFDETKLLSATSIAKAPTGTLLENLGGCGSSVGQMLAPRGIAVDTANNAVFVAETGNNRITRWNLSTNTATVIKPTCGGKGLAQPWGISWDPSHTWLYIGDVKNARIVRMKPDGSSCQVVVTQADLPSGDQFLGSNFIQFDSAGRMWVSDNSRHIYGFTITG